MAADRRDVPCALERAARLYVAAAFVPRVSTAAVGALGRVRFERGWYAYVGSAQRARRARVARHMSADKPLRWHADYLFSAFPATRAWLVDAPGGAGLASTEARPGGAHGKSLPCGALPASGTALPGFPLTECGLIGLLLATDAGMTRAAPRFGAGDCGCDGHLLRCSSAARLQAALDGVGTSFPGASVTCLGVARGKPHAQPRILDGDGGQGPTPSRGRRAWPRVE